MLGYDVRKYQLLTFVIGSGLGLSGALYTSWGSSSPRPVFACRCAAMPIVWAFLLGRSDLGQPRWSARSCSCSASRPSPLYSQQAALVLMGALARHGDVGAARLCAWRRQAGRGSMERAPAARRQFHSADASPPATGRDLTMALVDVKGVTKRFGGLTAVSDVDLTVNAGEIHCLIGPNGAGRARCSS